MAYQNAEKPKTSKYADINVEVLCYEKQEVYLKHFNYTSKADLDEINIGFGQYPGDSEFHLVAFQASRATIFHYYGLLCKSKWEFKKALNRLKTPNLVLESVLHKEMPAVIELAVEALKNYEGVA